MDMNIPLQSSSPRKRHKHSRNEKNDQNQLVSPPPTNTNANRNSNSNANSNITTTDATITRKSRSTHKRSVSRGRIILPAIFLAWIILKSDTVTRVRVYVDSTMTLIRSTSGDDEGYDYDRDHDQTKTEVNTKLNAESMKEVATVQAFWDKKQNEADLLDWVRSKCGYWNPKQDLRYDETIPGLYGIYATDPIEEDELLASILWDCVIAPAGHQQQHPPYANRFDDNCNLVQRLADELANATKHGSGTAGSSEYSHYIDGLLQTAADHYALLPAHWSPAGKKLLEAILFDEHQEQSLHQVLPPEDPFLEHDHWKSHCESTVEDPRATLLVMTHGEDFGMVPLTDKYNHRGGEHAGAYFSLENGPGDTALEIRALRSLQKDEQIYTDYRDYSPVVGTPELLRDYGFVELYPQRWIFPEQHLAFDIIREMVADDGNVGGGGYELRWHKTLHGLPYRGKPDPGSVEIAHFRRQHERLQRTIPQLLEASNATRHELKTVLHFYESLVQALTLAISD